MLLQPSDLVGCRYRLSQKQRHPDIPPTDTTYARRRRLALARRQATALLPTHPQRGDKKLFHRVDLGTLDDAEDRWFATLEALAAQATIITDAMLHTTCGGHAFAVPIDALVRRPDGNYMPVLITNHRIIRPDPNRSIQVMSTRRLGLGTPNIGHYRLKHHSADSFTLALANHALADVGHAAQRGILIGQDPEIAVILDTELLEQGLQLALKQPIPAHAHRVKECGTCRFWPLCEAELVERDDLSLLFAGDKSAQYQREGIITVADLAQEPAGNPVNPDIILARAFRRGSHLVKRRPETTAPSFDLEIDIDVEAYLDRGVYLWGAYDGTTYHPFATWDDLGGRAEAENFARFWTWLTNTRRAAHAAGKTVGVFCYSNHGENYWLLSSARKFESEFSDIAGLPSMAEVQRFIASPEWLDVFALVRRELLGTHGLGLKIVARATGFSWDEQDVDGEASIGLYLAGTPAARAALLSYNGDDCRATAAVRRFLAAGAPGLPSMADFA